MGVLIATKRGFHVLLCGGENMGAPKGLIEFSKTSVCTETTGPLKQELKIYFILSIITAVLSYYYPMILVLLVVCLIFTYSKYGILSYTENIPLAVNLNHPFMGAGSLDKSEISVNFSNKWIDPGTNLLKLAKDPIQGWVVHKQDAELSVLSPWDTKKSEKILSKQLTIINQAISLNNAINDSNDEFEDARERESQESSLLERNWLPEEEIDIQGPISKMFSSE